MDTVMDIAFTLCVVAIVGAVIMLAVPECPQKRMLKIVFCTFVIVTALSPVSLIRSGVPELSFDFKTDADYMDRYEKAVKLAAEERLKAVYLPRLEKLGYILESLEIETETEDYMFRIKKVNITVQGEHKDISETEKNLSDELGLTLKIKVR